MSIKRMQEQNISKYEAYASFTERAEEKGFERGLKEGFERGFKEGFKEGFEKGKKIALINLTKSYYMRNMSIKEIADLFRISEEEVYTLLDDK
jgi:flagellar biosynthesis/type III secretory pathway protein FliH